MSISSAVPASENDPSDASPSSGVKASRRGRWRMVFLLSSVMIAVLASALTLPVPVPVSQTDVRANTALEGEAPGVAPPEDLDGFLATALWGKLPAVVSSQAPVVPVPEPPPPPPEPEPEPAFEATTNPELQKIGFIGLIVTGDNSAMLLQGESGEVTRYGLGDALPDGRALVSVSGNSLTLRHANGETEEVLELFPRSIPGDPISGDPSSIPAASDTPALSDTPVQ